MLELSQIHFSFSDSSPLFQGLSFSVKSGEHVALSGPSGAGKSSLFLLIMGWLQLTQGRITVEGMELTKSNLAQVRNKICWIPQSPLNYPGTVEEEAKLPYQFRANRGKSFSQHRLWELMQELDLPESKMQSSLASLSGGEKQRMAFALGLMMDRPLLLLDEPSAALDEHSRDLLLQLLEQEKGKGRSILSISHDPAYMKRCDRVLEISRVGQL